ncbi:hypothetical protein [Nonomuraea sp. LPB2021202275-12-8]|uniref:hypothetical protein n=1 Tax=Nonomuraea sp. LPB2021202275-12-8 TaxID=3120159 RepID=UPI00300D1124
MPDDIEPNEDGSRDDPSADDPSRGAPEPYRPVDPRDEPAPFGAVVLLTAGSAVAILAIYGFFGSAGSSRPLLLGPITLVVFEVVMHEVWWRRWWGAIPGAIVGLVAYFEGRAMLADIIGDAWGEPVAFVAAWTLFAVIFALASRYPRTNFTGDRALP